MTMKTLLLLASISLLRLSPEAAAQKGFTVRGGDEELSVSSNGEITGIRKRSGPWNKHVRGVTVLDSSIQVGGARVIETHDRGIQVTRDFVREGGKLRLSVVDRFTPETSSIRWDVEVEGGSEPWSTRGHIPTSGTTLSRPVLSGTCT